MRKIQAFLLIICCSLYEARGQPFSFFGRQETAKPIITQPKGPQPLVVLPDHLKEDDEFEKMKQEINQGFGLKINVHSYDETAALRDQIQQSKMSSPIKANLGALGGSKEKKPSGKVGKSQNDSLLSSKHRELVASHPVVLPDHLQKHDDSHKMQHESDFYIDPNSFHEAAVIRSKIKESQMGDTNPYQSSGSGSQINHGPSHMLGSSHDTVSKSVQNKPLLNKNIFINREYYGANGELLRHEPLFDKSKNIWHGNVGQKGKNLRDQLTLTKVAVNVEFAIGKGADIEVWKAFRKFSNKHFLTLIAMTNDGLLLVQEQGGKFEVLQHVEVKQQTFYVEVFEKWDDETNSWVGVVIVSTPAEIIWYETKGDHKKLEEVWRWNVHKKMVQIKYFRYKNTDFLLLANDATPSSADIYEFDYFRKLFWIAQVIPLEFPSTSVGILRYGDGFLICLPQKDEVLVFEYQKTVFDHGRLIFKEKVEAKDVKMVKGFTVGGYTYLAIGGVDSRILMYTGDNGFVQKEIKGDQLKNVIYWFPIHIHTYRDDLLLLALRETDLVTHRALDIKGVVWNLDSFRVTPNIPCDDDEEDLTKGLTCILDPYRKEGLWGSGFVQHDNHLTLVIPQNEAPSALYDLYYEIVPAPDPIIEELEKIEETYELLADIVEYQDRVVENALEAIANALNRETDNYITGEWEFHHLGAQEVIQSNTVKWENDQIQLGDSTWSNYDHRLDLATLDEYLQKSELELEFISSEISYNRPLRYSDSPFYSVDTIANGNFDINSINVLYPTFSYKKESLEDKINLNRNKRHLVVAGPVEFETLEVQELEVRNINGIPASDIIFADDPVVEFNGPVTFENIVSVDEFMVNNEGKVNGIDLDKDLIHFTNPVSIKLPLKFELLEAIDGLDTQNINPKIGEGNKFKRNDDQTILQVQKLEVFGNVNAKNINGRDWNDFVTGVTSKNLPSTIEKLTINGTVFVDHTNLDVVHLNELNFVNDLVFGSSQDSYVRISGKKSFNNGLFAQQIDCETLDGIYTPDVITLGDYQKIPGKSVFTSLEVSDDLEVNGKIQGDKLDDFEENLTLLQSRIVDASTIFSYLRVEGPIKIRDTFNGKTVDEALGNVIYTDGTTVEVNSYKYFEQCSFEEGIYIKSGLLNGVDTKDIVTKSTEQEITFNELVGDVLFQRLDLDGLFDFINATELDINTVKLNGDQYSEVSVSVAHPVITKSVKINKELNGHLLRDFYRIDQEIDLKGEIIFNELLLDQGHIFGGIHTNGYLNGINLKEFDETRLSLTRPQHISVPCYLKDVTVNGNMRNEMINQVPTHSFTNNVLKAQSVRNLMYSGEILIDNLYVEKNVAIKNLNGIDLNNVLENVVWLNRPSSIYGDLSFLDSLTVYGNVSYGGLLNGQHFGSFIEDLVLKNQETIYLKGVKGFPNGFSVATDVDTEYINEVNARDVLRKDGSVACQGLVNIHGNLHVRYVDISGTLNNISLHLLSSIYEYDTGNSKHVIKGDVNLHESVQMDHLTVTGPFNSIPDISAYIHSIVRDDKDCNMTGRKSILNIGFFDQGVDISEFNGINLSEMAKDIVLVNPTEKTVIHGLVSFHEPVFASSVHIHNDIATHNIADCSPQEWVYNGIMINQHEKILTSFKFKTEHLTSPSFLAVNLNGKPTEDIISLQTAQHFASSLDVNELYLTGAIHVGGTVNRLKLPLEKENSLMIYGGSQHIATYNTAFASLRVLQELTMDHLNGVPTSNIATLYEDLYFDTPLEFKAIEANSLKTVDLISGINFNYWYDKSLISGSRVDPQKVHKNWTIGELYLESDLNGNGLMNHVKVDEIVQSIAMSKASTDEVIVGVAKEYQDVCHNIKKMSDKAKAGIYFFKYFEQKFEVRSLLEGKLQKSHYFQIGHDQYMLLNIGCMSEIFQWSMVEQKFAKLGEIKTGYVSEELVFKNDSLLVLSSAHNGCDVKRVLLLKVERSKVISVRSLEENVKSIHAKPIGSTFYGLIENFKVIEYDEGFRQIQEWVLPETMTDYRFLPFELGIGLALSDGRTIIALTSMKNEIRNKRQMVQEYEYDNHEVAEAEVAEVEVEFSNAEWRQMPSSTVPSVIYHTMDPLRDVSTFGSIPFNDYDNMPKLSESLRKQAASDLQTTTNLQPDYFDPSISPAWKYLHKETDIIKANVDTHKPKDLPNLPTMEEENFQNSFRSVVADVNRKIDVLRDMIVTTQINNLTELSNVDFGIISNFDIPFGVIRLGRTLSPYEDTDLQNTDETQFGNYMRSEFTKWNEATHHLKDLLLKIDEKRRETELSDPIVEASQLPIKSDVLPGLQSADDAKFTNQLRDLVSKWNRKGSDLQTSLKDTQSKKEFDPVLTQEQDLKDVLKFKHPTLQSTNDKEFNDQIRGLVTKWNEKVAELKLALDNTHTTEKTTHEEPIVAQIKVLEDLLQKQLPMLQSSDETDFVQEMRLLVSEWNKKANALENVIKAHNVEKELDPILTKMNELRPFMKILPLLQTTEEKQFSDQLRMAIGKWNEVSSKLKDNLESYTIEPSVGQEHVQATTDTSVRTTPAMQSSDEQKYSQQMKEQISKWNELSQKITDKIASVDKTPISLPATTRIPPSIKVDVTEAPILSLEVSDIINTVPTTASMLTVQETTQKSLTQTVSSPDDVQMIPDLKKTFFVEQTESTTTLTPEHRFVLYETTLAPISDWQASTTEPTVAQAIPEVSVKLMENFFLPAKHKGEIVLLNVGIHGMQRKLIAVSSVVNKRSTIPGQHDVIQIYEDIYEGKLFQTIPCYQPSGLSVIHLRDETLLAFLEGNSGVRVYAYRGIQGFVQLSNFNLPRVARTMEHVQLNQEIDDVHQCATDFLAVTTDSDVIFYQANTEPENNCHVKASFKCD